MKFTCLKDGIYAHVLKSTVFSELRTKKSLVKHQQGSLEKENTEQGYCLWLLCLLSDLARDGAMHAVGRHPGQLLIAHANAQLHQMDLQGC